MDLSSETRLGRYYYGSISALLFIQGGCEILLHSTCTMPRQRLRQPMQSPGLVYILAIPIKCRVCVQSALMVSCIRSCKWFGQARGSGLFQTMPQTVIIQAGVMQSTFSIGYYACPFPTCSSPGDSGGFPGSSSHIVQVDGYADSV